MHGDYRLLYVCFGQYQYAHRARKTTIQWKKFHSNELDYVCVFIVRFTKKSNVFIIPSRVHSINRTLNRTKSVSDGRSSTSLICNHASRRPKQTQLPIEHKRFLIERNNSSLGVNDFKRCAFDSLYERLLGPTQLCRCCCYYWPFVNWTLNTVINTVLFSFQFSVRWPCKRRE